MKEPIYLITWRDSNRYIEQCHKDDNFEVEHIKTVGFVIKETENQFVLAQDSMQIVQNEDYRGIIAIPKENVLDIVSLKSFLTIANWEKTHKWKENKEKEIVKDLTE